MGGKLIISLDFELMWGLRDLKNANRFLEPVSGVRKLMPELLNLFKRYQVTATFATVGFLFFKNKKDLVSGLPSKLPQYHIKQLSPYDGYLDKISENEQDDYLHYAPSLIRQIIAFGHEIATHTFSHYYCLEEGQSPQEFREDLKAAIATAGEMGLNIRSIVFPRNQYSQDYINVCHELGLRSFRGNERSWIYAPSNGKSQHPVKRVCRLLDSYINLSGHHIYGYDEIKGSFPYNIPSSAFLRPYSEKMALFERLKVNRIKKGMTAAAKEGKVFHLWWHPHNFGINTQKNLASLNDILTHYQHLHKRYHFASLTMADLADKLDVL